MVRSFFSARCSKSATGLRKEDPSKRSPRGPATSAQSEWERGEGVTVFAAPLAVDAGRGGEVFGVEAGDLEGEFGR